MVARTSSHSAERLNLCLGGKELSSMFHLSLFPVTCAKKNKKNKENRKNTRRRRKKKKVNRN